jgi:hypothetical protein
MNETNLMQLVRLRASQLGAVLYRNNTGKLQTKDGRWVSFGLCVGGSDLIGYFKGRFTALEIKMPGKKPTPEQQHFIDMVNKSGGIGAVVTDPDQLENIFVDTK